MKSSIALLCALVLALAGCNGTSTTPSKPVGRWSGSGDIIVQWAKQQQLPVTLDVAADGTVTGTVGDARLVDGKFVANSLGNREFRVHGKLQGNLIDAEQVRRDEIDILFDHSEDDVLSGGLHSSGSEFGGSKSMKLSVAKMELRREPAAATLPVPPR